MLAVSTDVLIYSLLAVWVVLVITGFYVCYYVGYSHALSNFVQSSGSRHILIEDDEFDDADDWEDWENIELVDLFDDDKQEMMIHMEDRYEN